MNTSSLNSKTFLMPFLLVATAFERSLQSSIDYGDMSDCRYFPGCSDIYQSREGDDHCCPNKDGEYFECCWDPWPEMFPKHLCKANPRCKEHATSPSSSCCPNDSNVTLACCDINVSIENIFQPTRPIKSTSDQCINHLPCSHLTDLCCPTRDGIFLHCCTEEDASPAQFHSELTLHGATYGGNNASYWLSTGSFSNRSSSSRYYMYKYTRNPAVEYDLIYFHTQAIYDAQQFVSGKKKFSITLTANSWSTVPLCAPILLQLDSVPLAKYDNYPTGRHSRYIAFTSGERQYQTLHFDFLDRPDGNLPDVSINAIVLFFNPGSFTGETYEFLNLNIIAPGCPNEYGSCNLTSAQPNSCRALNVGEASCTDGIDNDQDGLIDCADPDCSMDADCTTSFSISMLALSDRSISNEVVEASGTHFATFQWTLSRFFTLFCLAFM